MKKEIPGYEGLYAVDTEGNVWSLKQTASRRKGKLKPYENTGGYLRVNLYSENGVKKYYVHRLVADVFVPNPDGCSVVNHKDANPKNNRADNLEWCDQKYNIGYSRKLGNQKKDIPVLAVNQHTGEVKKYANLNTAGIELFGRYWALRYYHQKYGDRFAVKDWSFEVVKGG